MVEFDDTFESDEDLTEVPRDVKIDEAKEVLLSALFAKHSQQVFYVRQIEILLENERQMELLSGVRREGFYHWITEKALRELAQEGPSVPTISETLATP
jgi:hypothetical protein